jgi:hypothetical protein
MIMVTTIMPTEMRMVMTVTLCRIPGSDGDEGSP